MTRGSRPVLLESCVPWMGPVAVLAYAVSGNRKALTDDNPLLAQERQLISQITAFWEAARRIRDAAQERTFTKMYGE